MFVTEYDLLLQSHFWDCFFVGKDRRLLMNALKRGEIPERSNGADCKSVGDAFGGSNPPLPTLHDQAEVAHLAERKPSKL